MRPVISSIVVGSRSVCEGCGLPHPQSETKLMLFACDQCGKLKVNSVPPSPGSAFSTMRYESFLPALPPPLPEADGDDAEPVSLSDRDVFVVEYDPRLVRPSDAPRLASVPPSRPRPSAAPPG